MKKVNSYKQLQHVVKNFESEIGSRNGQQGELNSNKAMDSLQSENELQRKIDDLMSKDHKIDHLPNDINPW